MLQTVTIYYAQYLFLDTEFSRNRKMLNNIQIVQVSYKCDDNLIKLCNGR